MGLDILIPAVLLDKSHVKARVVGHQHRVPHKFQKLGQNGLNVRIFHDHLIRDTGQLGDLKRNGPPWIDEGAERIHDLSFDYLYRPDLDDLVLDGAESRGLQVEYHKGIIQAFLPGAHSDLSQVVHHIAFHAVNDLERVCLVQALDIVVGIRKCLGSPMVRDRDGRMSPLVGAAHNILDLGDPVHIAHFRMAVELHALNGA